VSWTLRRLAELTGAEAHGDQRIVVERPVDVDADDPAGIAFCERRRHLDRAVTVGVVIVPPGLAAGDRPHLVAAHPRMAFNRILEDFQRPSSLPPGRHPTAIVDQSADIDPTVRIGPFVVVEAGARVGAGAQLFASCHVGADCVVGEETVLHSRVTLYRDVRVGRRCIIHSGAVLGADGFGFLPVAGRYRKVPHVGTVTIADDVEIGAGTTIDRATVGTTSIGAGSKIDNLVHIGHNVRIGADCVLAGQVGVGGSARIGDRVRLAGRAGVLDHVRIGDDVTLGAGSAAFADLPEPGVYWGQPARPFARAARINAVLPRLADLVERVRRLERHGA
jgi:UDP-3-O-[3-hydroxymyristoyl] glucosamine N-acyltransferase